MSRTPPVPKRAPKKASPAALRDAIRNEALRLGFDAVGFAPANLAPEARQQRLAELCGFVAEGYQGDMGWLGDRTEERVDPATLWPEARTVVSLALNYAPDADPLAVLGERERAAIPVYAPKAHFGCTGAAAGLLELAASVLALTHGELPGTPNHTTPDPACPVHVHTGPPRKVTKPFAVKLSFTDLGHCAAAVVKKWDG